MTHEPSDFASLRRRLQSELFARLPDRIARLSWSSEQVRRHQRDRLRALLAHARERSPFHARRLHDVDPEHFELADLAGLPVFTKAEMMDAFDEVTTDRRLTRARVEETLAATQDEPIALFGEFLCQASGGSSGRRGIFVQDGEASIEFGAAILRPTMARMARAGASPQGFTIGFVAAESAVHATGIAPKLMEGSPIRFQPVPATLPLAEIVARLNALEPRALYGYATMLARLAAEKRAGRLRIAPTAVSTTSETLLAEQRADIADAFGVPVVDVFATSEGLVGVSDPGDPVIMFASDLCIVEPVDEHDRPVPAGTPSARILVTCLESRAQPLIRYAIDDRLVTAPGSADHGHLRATVEGRADEILRYGTVEVHPIVIRSVLVKTPEIEDYQVRQTACGVDVTLHAERSVDLDDVRGRLRAALAAAGLAEPAIVVRSVRSLAREQRTGKLRRFFPLAGAA